MIYEINMSKGQNIKIDEDDLTHIEKNLRAPLIRVKQAIINPSFMVSITPTDEQEFTVRKKVVEENGVAKIVGEEQVRLLTDKMNVKKLLN